MVTENISGMMALCTKENGSKIKSMGAVFISGQMAENITGNGKIITCTVKDFINGQTGVSMKVNI